MLPIVDIRIEIQVWVLQFESFAKLEGSRYLVKKHTGEFGTGFWIEFVGTVKKSYFHFRSPFLSAKRRASQNREVRLKAKL
jgi:hypothetical protein